MAATSSALLVSHSVALFSSGIRVPIRIGIAKNPSVKNAINDFFEIVDGLKYRIKNEPERLFRFLAQRIHAH